MRGFPLLFTLRRKKRKQPFCSPRYLVFIFYKISEIGKNENSEILKGNLRRKKNDRSGAVGCVVGTYRIEI